MIYFLFFIAAYKTIGVYGINVTTGQRYHDTTGLPQKGAQSDYQILTPVMQINDVTKNSAVVMFNLHSEKRRAKAIDYSLDCVRYMTQLYPNDRASIDLEDESYHYVSTNCTSITEVVFLVQDPPKTRPASVVFFPILANNDVKSVANQTNSIVGKKAVPHEVIGFVSAVHNWDTLLSLSTNDKVTGIIVVLSNNIESHTFVYDNGVVKYIGLGDYHDSKYDSQRYAFPLNSDIGIVDSSISTPLTYSITLYPTHEWVSLFVNDNPAITCGIAVGLVVFTSLIFVIYDYLINRNVNAQELIMQTKRQFVRYISHEIRTPLNVVLLGFQLLAAEMSGFPHDELHGSREGYVKQFSLWLQLIDDIAQSAENAICVLNDLMSYDKLDTGTLMIERELLPIWELIRHTIHPFTVQAKAKNIELELIFVETKSSKTTHCTVVDEHPTSSRTAVTFASHGTQHSPRLAIPTEDPLESVDVELGEVDGNNHVNVDQQIVLGDKAKLSQVIRNLISNALKFTPSGGKVTIHIHWEDHSCPDHVFQLLQIDANGGEGSSKKQDDQDKIDIQHLLVCGKLILSVTDTGAGMSQDNLSHLFQEGVQFNPGKLQAGQGSGLGLWISKGIVGLHRGKLSASSEGVGKGSTFTLELPLLAPKERPADPSPSHSHEIDPRLAQSHSSETLLSSPEKHLQHSMSVSQYSMDMSICDLPRYTARVLIVDDSEPIRKMLCRSLTTLGCRCRQVEDGVQCLEFIQKVQDDSEDFIDIIFMDNEMPNMTGPEAVTKLRELGICTPVIGVTGNVLQEDTDFFLKSGANKILHKPFTIKTLESVLKEFISRTPPLHIEMLEKSDDVT